MNWLINIMEKEARSRRFRPSDRVRFFTEPLKGRGNGVVVTPRFEKATVVDYDSNEKKYRVKTDNETEMYVHPRNMVHDSAPARQQPAVDPQPQPLMVDPIAR